MRVAIMQPYVFPYIGYFQLIAAVDRFVVYDTVKYTKKGWINRNRILRNGEPALFTVALEKASDALDIRERRLASTFRPAVLRAQIAGAYKDAPFFEQVMPVIEAAISKDATNLYEFISHALRCTCDFLGIHTPILTSSQIEGHTSLRKEERVLDICTRLGASTYVNPIGGLSLYEPEAFAECGVALRFLKTHFQAYAQFSHPFVPGLSIIDVMMFNPAAVVSSMLQSGYELVTREEGFGCRSGENWD